MIPIVVKLLFAGLPILYIFMYNNRLDKAIAEESAAFLFIYKIGKEKIVIAGAEPLLICVINQ